MYEVNMQFMIITNLKIYITYFLLSFLRKQESILDFCRFHFRNKRMENSERDQIRRP